MQHLPCLNRVAVIITPKQPFINWIKSQDPSFKVPVKKHDYKNICIRPTNPSMNRFGNAVK